MLIGREILERAEIEVAGEWAGELPQVTIDTRDMKPGQLFWALQGQRSDGHEFVRQAFEKGAAIAAVRRDWAIVKAGEHKDNVLFIMEDTLTGLQDFAREVRETVGARVIGVTGSNGKTTTRELVAAALRPGGKTAASRKNYNNHIGLPLTILNLEGDEKFLVAEMGANHTGEIASLCDIAQPVIGVITNIGEAHLGGFGSIENVQRAKGELFAGLAKGGEAIVNLDDERVVEVSADNEHKVGYTLGIWPEDWTSSIYAGKVVGLDSWSRPILEIEGMRTALALPGRHWASNALAAYAVAVECGVDAQPVIMQLATVEPLERRGRIISMTGGCQMMDDSYNANVVSIEAALIALAGREGFKVAVLGDISEMGVFEEQEHRRLGRLDVLDQIDRTYFVGTRMAWSAEEADLLGQTEVVRIPEEEMDGLVGILADETPKGASILVKGSRAMGLERIVDGLSEAWGEDEGKK